MGKIHDRLKIPRQTRLAQTKAALVERIREARRQRDGMQKHASMQGLAAEAKRLHIKGRWDGLCNRTQCLSTGAFYYNRGSYAFYCGACARDLNHVNRGDAEQLLGAGQQLCVLVETAAEAAKLHISS